MIRIILAIISISLGVKLILAMFFTTGYLSDGSSKKWAENLLPSKSKKSYFNISGYCHEIPSNYIVMTTMPNPSIPQLAMKPKNQKCEKIYAHFLIAANFISKEQKLVFENRLKWVNSDLKIDISDESSVIPKTLERLRISLSDLLENKSERFMFLSTPNISMIKNFDGKG